MSVGNISFSLPVGSTGELAALGGVLPMFIAGLVCNVAMLPVSRATFSEERRQSCFVLLLIIQLEAFLVPLLTLLLLATILFGISVIVKLGVFCVLVSIPTQVAVLDFLLAVQRLTVFSSSGGAFCAFLLLFPVVSLVSYMSMVIYLKATQTLDNVQGTNFVFILDLCLRVGLPLLSSAAYTIILCKVKRSRRKVSLKKNNENMIVVQAMPIALFQLGAASLEATLNSRFTDNSNVRVFIIVCILFTSSIVVPLSIVLGNTQKRHLLFRIYGDAFKVPQKMFYRISTQQ